MGSTSMFNRSGSHALQESGRRQSTKFHSTQTNMFNRSNSNAL